MLADHVWCRMLFLAILIAFYIVVAVGVAATTNEGTQHVYAGTSWKCIPHPSWAWWLVSSMLKAGKPSLLLKSSHGDNCYGVLLVAAALSLQCRRDWQDRMACQQFVYTYTPVYTACEALTHSHSCRAS